MNKRIFLLFLMVIMLLTLSACGNKTEVKKSKAETPAKEETVSEGKSKEKEANISPTETPKAEELDTKDFSNLSKVAEQVGFSFRAVENFKNDYSFQSFSVLDAQDKDENGKEVGEAYKKVVLNYQDAYKTLTVTIYPKKEEIKAPPTFVSDKKIGGIKVSLTEYILRMTDKDYKLTKEDKELMEKGNIGFSCDGVTIGDVYYRGMYWQEDGLYYEIKAGIDNMPVEELEAMTAEIINSEKQ